ncbi:hypothetical protein NLJ89_g3673 [Agrocybe chaxingu]|uniref:Uncharacterized protein n=1 Tax=Agrocybe chaxingu TaxID=84603 RepID=A0A9W8KAQ7_9AGAR|nr:hypothetical protein NLJ89_g3673 [Agrocybe chaxingu]
MPFQQDAANATANFDCYNDVAGDQINNVDASRHNTFSAGDGGDGGRGGDINNTTINHFYGPQFIVNSKGRALDFDESRGKGQFWFSSFWLLQGRDNGQVAVVSVDNAEYLRADGDSDELRLGTEEQRWRCVPDGPAYKLVKPGSTLAVTLSEEGGLSPLSSDNSDQSLRIMEANPESGNLIKGWHGTSDPSPPPRPTKELQKITTANGSPPEPSSSQTTNTGGVSIVIHYYGGGQTEGGSNPFEGLQNLLASPDGGRNLIFFMGPPMMGLGGTPTPPAAFISTLSEPSSPLPVSPVQLSRIPFKSSSKSQAASTGACFVTSSSASIVSKIWFTTEKLEEDVLEKLASLQLITNSRDQGYIIDEDCNGRTWFELAILASPADTQPKIVSGGRALTWTSHHNRKEHSETSRLLGRKFTRDHEIFSWLEPCNAVGVLVCAQNPGWANYAKSGQLNMGILD